jgi:tRNA U34 5-methylaminomethyl-2-thiouridine-forming methyltransferase MnmC
MAELNESSAVMKYVVGRMKELSTYQGLLVFLTGFGVVMAPEMWESITMGGTAIFGALSTIFPDKFSDTK